MFFIKTFFFGFAIYFATMIMAGGYVGVSVTPETADVDILAQILITSLFVWFMIAATMVLLVVKINKMTLRAVIARTVFIWAPINVGWFVTAMTGGTSWYLSGLAISSLFLSYEVLVQHRRQKMKP